MTFARPLGAMLLALLTTGSVASADAIDRHDVIRVVDTAAADQEAVAVQKIRALLTEFVAAEGFTGLPPTERLAKLDSFLVRMKALGVEVTGTRAAPIYERTLKDLQEERASVAAQLGRDPAAVPGAAEGAYTDFEWLGQRAVMALTNPLQQEDFRTSLARGIDFNVGVSSIEPSPAGWLVQLSGRLGNSGTPGQGFFCRVDKADTASLAVLRTVTPPYGIIHVTAPRADEFLLSSSPMRIRIVFEGCRVSAPDSGPRR